MRRGLPDVFVRRTNASGRFGLRVSLFVAGMVLVAVPFTALLFQVLLVGPLTRLDGDVADSLNRAVRGSDELVALLRTVSWLGWPPALTVVVGVATASAWRSGAHRLSLFLLATALGGGALSLSVKLLVDRPRPDVDHPVATAFGSSFPSGHALGSTVVYGAVLLAFLPLVRRRRAAAVAATGLVVLAIGASRILLGVHFVSDVVGGHVLGLAWLCASTAAFQIWRTERGRRSSHPLAEGVEPEAEPTLRGDHDALVGSDAGAGD